MNNTVYYTPEQMDRLADYIQNTFGNGEEGLVGHEIESEYVHTDVAVVTTREGDRCFVTFGVSAREMNSPVKDLARIELMMCAGKDLELSGQEALVIASELQGISKFPFREDTWLGPCHTINASDRFRETFGFDVFAFDLTAVPEIEGIGRVLFLIAVPIYEAEWQAMVEGNTLDVLEQLESEFGETIYYADSKRAPLPF